MKKTRQISIILLLILISPCILFAHGGIRHANDLCYAMFGFSQDSYIEDGNIAEMENCLGKEDKYYKAFEIMKNAIAVAIDYTNNDTNGAYDYLFKIKDNLKHGLPLRPEFKVSLSGHNIASFKKTQNPELLKKTKGNHRNVCHQGFDFSYVKFYEAATKANNIQRNETDLKKMKDAEKRWNLGRQLLIDAASYAFDLNSNTDPNDSIATFIAMNAYYIHLLGDLETDLYLGLFPIDSYKSLLKEYSNKIETYGNRLTSKCHICKKDLKILIKELNDYQKSLANGGIEGMHEISFKRYTKHILDILHKHLPQIIMSTTHISTYSKVS